MPSQECPIAGCGEERNGEMCRLHWYRVSKNTRNLLWTAYRNWERNKANPERFAAYMEAVNMARQEATA